MHYINDEVYVKERLQVNKMIACMFAGSGMLFGLFFATHNTLIPDLISEGVRNAITVFGMLVGMYLFLHSNFYRKQMSKSETKIRIELEKFRGSMATDKEKWIRKDLKETLIAVKLGAIGCCGLLGFVVDDAIPFNDYMLSGAIVCAIGSVIFFKSKWYANIVSYFQTSIRQQVESQQYPD